MVEGGKSASRPTSRLSADGWILVTAVLFSLGFSFFENESAS
jgi:hypothetical protein